MKKLKGWIKNFFFSIFSSAKSVSNSAKALKARAANVEGVQKTNPLTGRYVTHLQLDGKASKVNVKLGLSELGRFSTTALMDIEKISSSIEKLIKDGKGVDNRSDKIDFPLSKLCPNVSKVGERVINESDELIGGRSMRVEFRDKNHYTDNIHIKGTDGKTILTFGDFTEVSVKFGPYTKLKDSDGLSLEPLDSKEVIAVADAVILLCDSVEKNKSIADKLSGEIEKLLVVFNRGLTYSSDIRCCQALGRILSAIPSALLSECVRTSNHALHYAHASLNSYNAKAA